jgi:hypothetical protein
VTQDLQPHKTRGKHTNFYILISSFSDGRKETKSIVQEVVVSIALN